MKTIFGHKIIITWVTLFLIVFGQVLFCQVSLFSNPAMAASMTMTTVDNSVAVTGNNSEICGNIKQINYTIFSSDSKPLGHHKDTDKLLLCCYGKTQSGQINQSAQDFSEKSVVQNTQLIDVLAQSPHIFLNAFSNDPPPLGADLLKTIIKRE